MRGLDWGVAVGVVWGIAVAGASTDVLQVSLSALIGFVGRLGKESPFSATATAAAASTLIRIHLDILATPLFFGFPLVTFVRGISTFFSSSGSLMFIQMHVKRSLSVMTQRKQIERRENSDAPPLTCPAY